MTALTAGPALAADLPVKAPVPPPPALSWSGVYLGGTVGWVRQNAETDHTAAPGIFFDLFASAIANGVVPAATAQDADGILGGITMGYNIQSGAIVYGIEADWSWTGVSATSTVNTLVAALDYPAVTTVTETKTDWLATLRGRVGVLATSQALLYLTGGLAAGHVSGSTSITPAACVSNAFCSTGSGSDVRWGWTVGAGGEYAFAPRWTAKLEYLYYDLGTLSYTANEISPAFLAWTGVPTVVVDTAITGSIVRGGVNYRF